MRRIIVDPEYLRMLAAQHTRHVGSLRDLLGSLNGAVGSMSTEERALLGISEQWEQAQGIARRIVEQTEAQAHYLNGKARSFEDADYAGALQIGKLAAGFAANAAQAGALWSHGAVTPAIPQGLVERFAGIGGTAGGLPVTLLASITAICGTSAIARDVGTPTGSHLEAMRAKAASYQ